MPIMRAACDFPVDVSSARRIVAHSIHSMFWRSFNDGTTALRTAAVPSNVIASRAIVEPVVRTTARSTVFSSWIQPPEHLHSREWRVPRLLFVERVRNVRPDFDLTPSNARS